MHVMAISAVTVDGVEYQRFNHRYLVSCCGKLLRHKSKGVLLPVEPQLRPDGYRQMSHWLVHRMVAAVWCPNPKEAKYVHHINHQKSDNRAANLEWLSAKEHIGERHADIPRGSNMSAEGRAKLRALRTGSVLSEATKQKQREASLRLGTKPPVRPVGYKMTAESVAKCQRNNANNRPCVIAGVTYPSAGEAARALGLKSPTLRRRIHSPNFTDYNYAA